MAEQQALMTEATMRVDDFVDKWRNAALRERANAQTHFNDLCAVLGVATPVEEDPSGERYTFEKRVELPGGGSGDADVWKRGHFGWEYKSGGKSLSDAYKQLLGYREGLENPPLLVVCDMNRFQIHTNFTNTEPREIEFTLKDLGENPTHYVRLLRDLFRDPNALHPTNDPRYITETAAAKFGEVAEALRERDGHDASLVARFLNRLIFCLFAESIGMFRWPRGKMIHPISEAIDALRDRPDDTEDVIAQLFRAMANRSVFNFGFYPIRWFNGGLFDERAERETLRLTGDLIEILADTAELSWARIDPAIFGTLFERGLDPNRRSQLGAHYTDPDNIMRVVEPVLIRPLRREFAALRDAVESERGGLAEPPAPYDSNGALEMDAPPPDSPAARVRAFHDRLAAVRVLDPACGSGNFLYVAMRALKDIEHDLIEWAQSQGVNGLAHRTGPPNMLGIDIDPFAVELSRMSLWIGHIQWNHERNIASQRDPVLGRADQIECRDAILAEDAEGNPIPAEWPAAEFIIGNPPFLGGKLLLSELGGDYIGSLRKAWGDAIGGLSDLCAYWHESARRQIERRASVRTGLLATSSITGRESRSVLERICASGGIFLAWRDEEWINDGASVRIAIIGQDDGREVELELNGELADSINANLSSGVDILAATQLSENTNVAFRGTTRNGPFDITPDDAERMLAAPQNVNGRPNSDVIFPFVIARDLAQRPRGYSVIDFGQDTSEKDAAAYERPFEYVKEHVYPARRDNRTERLRTQWWLYEAWRPGLRAAISSLSRYIATPVTSKHRFYVWLTPDVVCDATVNVIARDDDYTFGALHSRIHEVWALAQSTRLADGPSRRYVHTQCFNTFPFPWPLDTPDDALSDSQRDQRKAISAAAASLNEQREAWLNPPNLDPDELRQHTMTNLYNTPPTWLDLAHQEINEAVSAAYAWPTALPDDEILARLLALNLKRAASE